VLQVLTRPGEVIAQRPVLRLGDTSQMVAVCEVYETQVWAVEPNQPATITSRALASPLNGRVTFVGQMVAKNEMFSLDPTRAADNRVVQVRVDVDEDEQAARLVNLQVDVVVSTAKANGVAE
jgi:HlyD family secretion protein